MSHLKGGIPNKLIDEKSPYLLQHAYNIRGEKRRLRRLRKKTSLYF